MTVKKPKKEKKIKREIPLRPRGEVIQKQDRPSKVLFDAVLEQERAETESGSINHDAPPPTNKQESKSFPISPRRDFTKVANSIIRNAIPSGLFKGTSKNTYDALYQRTRGAIEPNRKIKAVQSDVLQWANVSQNTLRTHLKHLQSVGLLKIHYRLGDNSGAEYEVILPEEIPSDEHNPLLPPPPTTSYQKLVGPPYQLLVGGGGGFSPINIDSNDTLKTFLKTYTENDDEFHAMNEVFRQMGRGKQASWKELAELLKSEFEIASSRTDSISDPPAFLAEHLRRRLAVAKQNRTEKTKPFEPGKDEPIIDAVVFTPEPLNEEGRKVVLDTLRRMPREVANEYEDHYTAADWSWLAEKLG